MDTGGLFGATTDPLHALVVEHGLKALAMAGLVVLVVDAKDGLVPGDQEIARRVHELGRPVIVAVNKTDDKGPGRGRWSSMISDSTRWWRSPPNMAMASRSYWTR